MCDASSATGDAPAAAQGLWLPQALGIGRELPVRGAGLMLDAEIRAALYIELREHFTDDEETIFVDELGLCEGDARVDVAVIAADMHGFEIKSAGDTLVRLPGQVELYGRVLDFISAVVVEEHVAGVWRIVPACWGVIVVREGAHGVEFRTVREAQRNELVDAFYVAHLLWRDEAIDELKERGCARGVLSKPRDDVMRRLVEVCSATEIGRLVRGRLQRREGWRVAAADDARILLRTKTTGWPTSI
jgi:hypothetical protein